MWEGRDVISIQDFSRSDLEHLFTIADSMIDLGPAVRQLLSGRVVATAFFEPSTRTKLSFEAAATRLGASVISLDAQSASLAKGESIGDTLRMLDDYADLIVIRSPYEGAAKLAADLCSNPIINGGDGTQHHPTQAMIDLYTIRRVKGAIDGLEIGVVGDLKYGRAAASFIYGIAKFRPRRLWLIYPSLLQPREELRDKLEKLGVKTVEGTSLEEAIENVDVLYVTRIQRERFPDPSEYEKVRGSYNISSSLLSRAKEGMKILHPLPRIDELPYEIDVTENQAYFIQAKLGVPLRMALMALILGAVR